MGARSPSNRPNCCAHVECPVSNSDVHLQSNPAPASSADILSLAAWLGAIVSRLRSNQPAIPGSLSESDIEQTAKSFGARLALAYSEKNIDKSQQIPAIGVLLKEIHEHMKGRPGEEDLWGNITFRVPVPLPREVAIDLLDRNMCAHIFSHSWQLEEVWWRLTSEDDPEAVYNLAHYRYTRPQFQWHHIEEILHQFPWGEILQQLAHTAPSSPEKAENLCALVRKKTECNQIESERILRPHKSLDPTFATAWHRNPRPAPRA